MTENYDPTARHLLARKLVPKIQYTVGSNLNNWEADNDCRSL